jgi:hypothetical protein
MGLFMGFKLPAQGCSCVGIPSVAAAFKEADFVVVGTVKARTRVSASTVLGGAKRFPNLSASDTLFFGYRYAYTVEIEEVYKGDKRKRVVEILTGAGSSDCGVQFRVGSSYVIYAYCRRSLEVAGGPIDIPPFLATHTCTRTTPVNNAELKALRRVARH